MNLRIALALGLAPCAFGRIAPSGMPLGEIAWGDFAPLNCNANLETAPCENWSSKGFDTSGLVTIECGTCVTVDVATLDLQGGLDIVGKLVFPDNHRGTVTAPFIAVQGVLIMSSSEVVSSDTGAMNGLQFIFTGTDDVSFYPHSDNEQSCVNLLSDSCDMGKKGLAVFGGQLDIRGLQDTCPTWVKLLDVVTDDGAVTADTYPTPPTPNQGCSAEIITSDFDNSAGLFKKSLGTNMELIPSASTDGSTALKVSRRSRTWQGTFVNMNADLRECVLPDQVYLFSVKIKMEKTSAASDDASPTISHCMNDGTDCPTLNLHTMDPDENLHWKTLYALPGVAAVQDGNWFEMVAPITFPATLWDTTAKYQQLYIAGPEQGVDIYIDNFSIKLPEPKYYPDATNPATLCDDLIVNGDAETSSEAHYFPWDLEGNRGAHLSVKTDATDGNQYFSITGRTKMWTSIKSTLLHDCIVRNSIYKFNARVRLHSPEVANVRFTIRTHIENPEPLKPPFIVDSIGDCPPVSAEIGWVDCERNFLFREEHESAIKIEFIFVVEGDDTSDIDYDDIKVTRTAPPINKLVVPPEVTNCWGVGAEILTTSHTLNHYDHNVDTITAIETNAEGNAVVTVQNKIAKPTTAADDPNYAVEVALLSRNIRFAPADDDPVNEFHGGHLMVVHTPGVQQIIHGVEFRRFGQQGNLGRYPIHIHLSTDGSGVSIARNTIRESNQRCVVIHGTHNTTVEYNVAYDTFGHCYMLEDGIEQQNHIRYNLGASTKITPDEGVLSIAESDMFASTFWISNPHNYIQGNVAAGCEDTGIWIELLELVRGPSVEYDPYFEINPSTHTYGYFRDNVAHSNKGDGFKLYPNGYFPETEAVFENTLSFRNTGDGVLLHNSRNLAIDGGIYADNRIQIEVDKQADDVRVSNAVVIGYSPLYQIEVEAGNRKTHCPAYRPLVGIQLHSFLRYRDSDGYILENVEFSDFGEAIGCTNSSAIEMDPQVRDGHFDAFATFANLTFAPGIPIKEKFNMCFLEQNEMFIHDLAIQDLTGDLNPNENNVPGWIISNSPIMTAFQPEGNCHAMDGSCSLFCEGGCYRTMNYAVNVASEYDNMVMEVTRDDGTVTEFPGYFEWKTKIVQNVEVLDDYENYVYQRRKYYSPILPDGTYTMRFKKDGAIVWPQFVEETWENPPSCGPHISDGSLTLEIPTPTGDECNDLIRHGDAEEGTHNMWMHSGGGIQVVEPGYNSAYAFSSVIRKGAWQGPGQFLDTRCLVEGNQFEISARLKILDYDDVPQHCNVNQDDVNAYDVCPRVSFRIRKFAGNKIGDPVDVSYAYPLALTVGPYDKDQWNFIYGVFTVTESIANADAVFMFVDRARPGVNIVIDDVKMVPTVHGCTMPIYNTDFEVGDARFWGKVGTAKTDMWSPGYPYLPGEAGATGFALRTTERKEFWASMSQALNTDCLVEGSAYSVSSFILLLDENDNIIDCNPSLSWGSSTNDVCPTMSLRITTGSEYEDIDIASVTGPWNSGSWNSMHGIFTATAEMLVADSVQVFFRKFKEGKHIVIDDVAIQTVEASDPNQLMNNGDLSAGDTRHFKPDRGGVVDIHSPGYDDDYALVNKGRTADYFGVRQAIDTNVIEEGATYNLAAKIQLYNADMSASVDCDPTAVAGDLLCPVMYLRAQEPGVGTQSRQVGSVKGPWASGDWNTIEGTVVFFHNEIHAPSLNLVIDKAPANVVVVIDNIGMTKVTTTA